MLADKEEALSDGQARIDELQQASEAQQKRLRKLEAELKTSLKGLHEAQAAIADSNVSSGPSTT